MSDTDATKTPAADDQGAADSKVTIYTTTWCAFCHTEQQWLEHLGVKYVTKNIEEDKQAYEELMQKIGNDFRGVPVTDVAGDIVLGFDRPKLQTALKTHQLVAA